MRARILRRFSVASLFLSASGSEGVAESVTLVGGVELDDTGSESRALLSATSILDSVDVESFEKARFMVARVGVVYEERLL